MVGDKINRPFPIILIAINQGAPGQWL
jgi:hypothetical protein